MGVFGALAGGLIQASSARKAQKAQQAAADLQLQLQREVYEDQTGNFAPWLGSGKNYLAALDYELLGGNAPMIGGYAPSIETINSPQKTLPYNRGRAVRGLGRDRDGLGGRITNSPVTLKEPTRYRVNGQMFNTMEEAQRYAEANKTGGTQYRGYQASPGFQYAVDQGQNAIEASAAARGGLFSGATLEALQGHRVGLAQQDYGNYLARLMNMSASGQAAAGNQANAGANYASGAGTALANRGDAGAAGAVGFGNAINGGLTNALGIWNYQKQTQTPGGMGGFADLFGSKNWLSVV